MEPTDKVLVEYQMAQNSAEHHNNLMWTLIVSGIGFSLFIIYKTHLENNSNFLLNVLLLFIGAFTLFYFSHIVESSNEKKCFKYSVCKLIEEKYNFIGQNLKVSSLPISKTKIFNFSNFGMGTFRLMKILMFVFYLLEGFLITIKAIVAGENIFLFSVIFTLILLLCVASIIVEIYYSKVN